MEEAAPPCTRNAPGAKALKEEIEKLGEREKKLSQKIREKRKRLEKICLHPTKKRMVRSWGTTDTLGNFDGGYEDVYCTVCGQQLASNRV